MEDQGDAPVRGMGAVVLLAAGKSTRMHAPTPKPCLALAGKPIGAWTSQALLEATGGAQLRLVVSPDPARADQVVEAVASFLPKVEVLPVAQKAETGTGDAAATAVASLVQGGVGEEAEVLLAVADAPLLRGETVARLLTARREAKSESAWLGFVAKNPQGYGRMVFSDAQNTKLQSIVEEKDLARHAGAKLSDAVWSGVMVATLGTLVRLLPRLEDKNAQGEKLLTDLAGLIDGEGGASAVVLCDEEEALGINTRADLAQAERVIQGRLRDAALQAGAGLVSPENVWLAHDTHLEAGCVIEPWVWFGGGVSVAAGAEVRSFSHLEGVAIESGVVVGPFARVRPHTTLRSGVRVGNFVEVKAAELHEGVRVAHLSYIGDARIGAESNIGAGTITCNYDGVHKHRTALGKRVFVGSNSALVAPIAIGDGSIIGAGSVVRHNVASDAVVVSRAPQKVFWEPASGWRARKSGETSDKPLFAETLKSREAKKPQDGDESQ